MRVLTTIAELGSGGAEATAAHLAARLSAAGHDVVLASSGGWRLPLLQATTSVGHLHLPLAEAGGAPLVRSAARLVARTGRPDLLHAHNVRATLAAWPLAAARRVPLLTTVHGLAEGDYAAAARILSRCSDHVVAVSRTVAEDLRWAGLPADRISVVENAVVPRDVLRPSGAARPVQPGREERVVLCAARFAEQKRHDLLLRAWAAVADEGPLERATLVLAGDGPRREALERLARELGVGSSVLFVGDHRDVPALLDEVDLLVLPSDWEGLPVVVLEALAAGVPVVAHAVGGLLELEEVVHLVPPRDHQQLSRAMVAALDPASRDERSARRVRGRELVRDRFDVARMVAAYGGLYHRLAGRGRGFRGPTRGTRARAAGS